MDKKLEKRMYFFVPYQLTGIQQGIQAGHAALEYAIKYKDEQNFIDFVRHDKTWIILNGGTTNGGHHGGPLGTMQQLAEELEYAGIQCASFFEIDINMALTALCFIADERVWDYETYPDLREYLIFTIDEDYASNSDRYDALQTIRRTPYNKLGSLYSRRYELWKDMMGGEKNIFLRNLLKNKKLA